MSAGDRPSQDLEMSEAAVAKWLRGREWRRLAGGLGFGRVEAAVPVDALDAWGISRDAAEGFERLDILAADAGYRLLLMRGVERYSDVRRCLLDAQKRNPSECLVWWLVGEKTVTVAVVAEGPDGRRYVQRMETNLERPDPVGLRQWLELRLDDLADDDLVDPGEAVRRRVESVLSQEGITRDFFEGFRDALDVLTDEMESGPTEDEERHDVALATLLRIVFLYFLQERGALDGDRRFVLRNYRRSVSNGGGFYRRVLHPLFFGALNRAPDERDMKARELGTLPFLNGGLFEPIPAERDYSEIDWPDSVWPEIVEGLFERFHFTVDEGVGPDRNRAVDPEMLGKVFEGLMYGERRHRSGSFYTPRDVVREVVEGAVSSHFAAETSLGSGELTAVLRGGPAEIPSSAAEEVRSELASLHVLDPAVGTGAFLLEVLRTLETIYDSVEPLQAPAEIWERRRRIVHRHLFGVDIQQTAVRICELRLWLALLSVMPDWSIEEIPPLPNLSHRVACGNSLLEPTDAAMVERGANRAGARAFGGVTLLQEEHRRRVRETQDAFFRAHGAEKARLRRELESLESSVQRRLLEARRKQLEEKLEPFEKLEKSEDLFGESVELDAGQSQSRDRLREELDVVSTSLDELDRGREKRGGFSFAARFGPVLDSDGFDIVVTNPPWIRANRLERSERKLLKARYGSFSNDLWEGADDLGIRVPFGAQVDVAALFVERALELLRPGGRLAALLPAKLFRSLHGTGVRRLLAGHQPEVIRDYSDSERQMFEATVYPAVLQVRKRESDAGGGRCGPSHRRAGSRSQTRSGKPFSVSIWDESQKQEWRANLGDILTLGRGVGEPWVFVPPEVREIFDGMRRESTPLGEIEALQPSRGMMTGRNKAFVHARDDVASLLGGDLEEWSRPVLSGRDIRAWCADSEKRILWAYDDSLTPREDLPAPLEDYFAERAEGLRSRADYRESGPLWQLFRLKSGLLQPKVVWRDLAPRLEAAMATEEVLPLNTVYFIPLERRLDAKATVALFNSEPMRAFAYAIGERARGSWRRHFAWVMRLLPVPDAFIRSLEGDGGGFDVVDRVPASGEPDAVARRRIDLWSSKLFGLEPEQIDTLRGWRVGSAEEAHREAA